MPQEEIIQALGNLPWPRPVPGDWKDAQHQEASRRQAELFDDACEELCRRLRQEDAHDVFEALFSIACSRDLGNQALPVHILLYIKTPCPLSCTEAIRHVSRSEWDLSLEEVPWYVAACFGTDAIYQSLDELEAEDDIQEFRKVEAAWHALNSEPMSLSRYLETEKERPHHSVEARLDVIRYWTDILVRDEKGRLENWHPFWWRSKKPSLMD